MAVGLLGCFLKGGFGPEGKCGHNGVCFSDSQVVMGARFFNKEGFSAWARGAYPD